MCGFVGFTGNENPERKKQILHPMMDRIIHRGPDMGSTYTDAQVGLGFRRLSIIDLRKDGNQPMANEDGSIQVVFNGEIYNYQGLRRELQARGHVFSNRTDTEVLVHGWEEWGEQLVKRLRGMFSFVLWDKGTDTMFAARDYFGIKPFYFYELPNGNLLFGSEIKCFLDFPGFSKEVNPEVLRAYLGFQYPAGNETFFKGVRCLQQGHYLVWKRTAPLRFECYWRAGFSPDSTLSYEKCVESIDSVIHESVEAHRISDVTVGSFLSGGVDSSYITACLLPEKSFSVGFADEGFDESNHAAELSDKLGVQNYRRHVSAEECFEAFPAIQYHMDQPQSNPSCIPLWFLAKLAREHVTVVLSGEGADELFAGYEAYADTPQTALLKKLPRWIRQELAGIARNMPQFKGRTLLLRSGGKPEDWFIGQADIFSEEEALTVLKPDYRVGTPRQELTGRIYEEIGDLDEVTAMQMLDMNLWLPGDILLKADKMCMAHSLELRVPFLDKEVFSVAAHIPHEYRVQGTDTKVVFREAANRSLPDEWATRPKMGFPVPIRNWLRQQKYYEIVRKSFESDWASEFFETDLIIDLLHAHYTGRANNGRKIWTIFTFLTWYKCFFIDERVSAASSTF